MAARDNDGGGGGTAMLGAWGIAKYDDQSSGSALDAEVDDPETAAAAAAAATRFKSEYESIG